MRARDAIMHFFQPRPSLSRSSLGFTTISVQAAQPPRPSSSRSSEGFATKLDSQSLPDLQGLREFDAESIEDLAFDQLD
jgi:hypothetical protein